MSMSEESKRIAAWRTAKRKSGYRPLTLWVPYCAKSEFDELVYSRGQSKDPGQTFLEAVRYLAASQGKTPELRLEARQRHLMEQEIEANIIKRLTVHGHLPSTELSAPSVVPSPIKEPLPPEWKQCNAPAHPPYDGTIHEECPQHVLERQQRYRAKQKAQKPAAKKQKAQKPAAKK
jgi:hypothetical protein